MSDESVHVTHEVTNVVPPLVDYHPFRSDLALVEGVAQEGAAWAEPTLDRIGETTGTAEYIGLGFLANEHPPELVTHDPVGHRVDRVDFHPAYHQLMANSIEWGLHASPWTDPRVGAHVARAAAYYLHTQVEAAHGCPITMTFASFPTIERQPDLAEWWLPRIGTTTYDARNVPPDQKPGLTVGMAMTEKQGGSDVRANTTRARPLAGGGPGELYELVGHKFFVSAPMCDVFLVLAQAPGGLSCFLLPRWLPDGTKNPLEIQQLKRKMGNVANASCETELRGALAWMVGEEGRGVATIIEMVAMTRFDCMIGSSAGMRQAVAQATHLCAHRSAFGELLNRQPLMKNVLADLIVEHEAALAMTLRVARALDSRPSDQAEALFARIVTGVGKYWICKRTPGHAYEAMEVIGGSGVMETSIMPRLFRESPVNAIWEGSGNIQCLDVLRSIERSPEVLDAYLAEVDLVAGADDRFDRFVEQLHSHLGAMGEHEPDRVQYEARTLVDHLALALQGSLLLRSGDTDVADAFCASRLMPHGARNYGCLPAGVRCDRIIERATPVVRSGSRSGRQT